MRRLFSSFARGAPGLGLLLLRVTTGGSFILYSIHSSLGPVVSAPAAFRALLASLGLLLLGGLWTPVAASIAALVLIWQMVFNPSSWHQLAHVAVMAATLALVGPGGWSLDAWLYGWKEIRIPVREPEQDARD